MARTANLPCPARWPIFPFETECLRMTHLGDLVLAESSADRRRAVDLSVPGRRLGVGRRAWLVSMPVEPMSLPASTPNVVWPTSRQLPATASVSPAS